MSLAEVGCSTNSVLLIHQLNLKQTQHSQCQYLYHSKSRPSPSQVPHTKQYTILKYIRLLDTTLHHTTLHYTTLHHTTLHYTTFFLWVDFCLHELYANVKQAKVHLNGLLPVRHWQGNQLNRWVFVRLGSFLSGGE